MLPSKQAPPFSPSRCPERARAQPSLAFSNPLGQIWHVLLRVDPVHRMPFSHEWHGDLIVIVFFLHLQRSKFLTSEQQYVCM